MVELKIEINDAVKFLLSKMETELEFRGRVSPEYRNLNIESLNEQKLFSIAECAAFDLLIILPADLYTENNNLAEIVSKAFNAIGTKFNSSSLSNYSIYQAQNLMIPIRKALMKFNNDDSFMKN